MCAFTWVPSERVDGRTATCASARGGMLADTPASAVSASTCLIKCFMAAPPLLLGVQQAGGRSHGPRRRRHRVPAAPPLRVTGTRNWRRAPDRDKSPCDMTAGAVRGEAL